MATYKVIQDIEAEDKILGPLTLRQFIYALITAFLLYLNFLCLSKGAWFLLIIFVPPALFTGFFAFPFGKDQSTEVWALAKIRFYFKPRIRIWDQNGAKDLVTVTVPKHVERNYSNGLDQSEVKSRLQALANTIDSRGWAVKNVNLNMYAQPAPFVSDSSDRLIDLGSLPQEVPSYEVLASDDMLDAQSNPIAQQFEQLITASSKTHRKQLIDEMNGIRAEEKAKSEQNSAQWFTKPTLPNDSPQMPVITAVPVIRPGAEEPSQTPVETIDEHALAEKFKMHAKAQHVSYDHMRTIKPLGSSDANQTADTTDDTSKSVTPTDVVADSAPVTAPRDPAILSLASNNDLNVSTLAREAHKAKYPDQPAQDEVVVSLH